MGSRVDGVATLVSRVREQAGWCRRLGSPLYAHLLEHVALDLLAGGPSRDARAAIGDAVAQAGAAATRDAPLAWLRLEPVGREGPYEVRLTTWPDEREYRLGESRPHGRDVRWHE